MPRELPPIVGAEAPVKLPGAAFLLASALLVLALLIAAHAGNPASGGTTGLMLDTSFRPQPNFCHSPSICGRTRPPKSFHASWVSDAQSVGGRQDRGPAGRAADPLQTRHQPQNRPHHRCNDANVHPAAGRRGDRMRRRESLRASRSPLARADKMIKQECIVCCGA